MSAEYISISESVTAAHPDKLCDRISDEIVDRLLEQDPASRVVAEAAMFGGVVFLATRIATTARIDLSETARRGIARALMGAATDFAREAGAHAIALKTQTTNTQAQALYESLGWKRDDEVLTYELNL